MSGFPLIVRSRMGKSLRTSSTSSAAGRSSTARATSVSSRAFSLRPGGGPVRAGRVRGGLLRGEPQLLADAFVALLLELVGQLRAAGLHDPPAHHHVYVVRGDVVQDPLVVRDQEHAQV